LFLLGGAAYWWENPGAQDKPWRKTIIQTGAPVEFVFLVDLLNTGQAKQLLPQFGDETFPMSWYELVGKSSDAKWARHIVSPHSFGHGIGLGDINKDGRNDIITPKGWFEAPADSQGRPVDFSSGIRPGRDRVIYLEDVNGTTARPRH